MCLSVQREELKLSNFYPIGAGIRNNRLLVHETNHLNAANNPLSRQISNSNSYGNGSSSTSDNEGKGAGRYLIVGQILIMKISIAVLLIQIESLECVNSLRAWTLFASLMVAILLMHSGYDKYHARFYSTGRDRSSSSSGGSGGNHGSQRGL